jgi:hypothetical protein
MPFTKDASDDVAINTIRTLALDTVNKVRDPCSVSPNRVPLELNVPSKRPTRVTRARLWAWPPLPTFCSAGEIYLSFVYLFFPAEYEEIDANVWGDCSRSDSSRRTPRTPSGLTGIGSSSQTATAVLSSTCCCTFSATRSLSTTSRR